MGRIPSGSSERNGHCYSQYKTEQKDFEMSLARESVYKTSSAGAGMMKDHQSNLSSPRDNILVSNAQSKKEIECLDFQNNSQNDYQADMPPAIMFRHQFTQAIRNRFED